MNLCLTIEFEPFSTMSVSTCFSYMALRVWYSKLMNAGMSLDAASETPRLASQLIALQRRNKSEVRDSLYPIDKLLLCMCTAPSHHALGFIKYNLVLSLVPISDVSR